MKEAAPSEERPLLFSARLVQLHAGGKSAGMRLAELCERKPTRSAGRGKFND